MTNRRGLATISIFRLFQIAYTKSICSTIALYNGWNTARHVCRTKTLQSESSSPWSLFAKPSISDDDTSIRLKTLHEKLLLLGIEPTTLHTSAIQSIQDPCSGFDPQFGKSAIKTYRSYLTSSSSTNTTTIGIAKNMDIQLQASASRCAQQIDFLIKRHRSNEADWVRNIDKSMTTPISSTTAAVTSDRNLFPLILVLDHLRSAFNVGSLFRTADATGCSLVITIGITPHPGGGGHDKVSKSALGAERVVPHMHFSTMSEALEYLRTEKSNYTLIGMETTERSKSYTSLTYPKSGCVLILGNEVTGRFRSFLQKSYLYFS
jgi:tRNA G18 (ribose-2'-O)-methylase SpoU